MNTVKLKMKRALQLLWRTDGRVLFLRRDSYSVKKIKRHFSQTYYDVAIVGGGAMGSSSAYFLAKRRPDLRICVIERDPTYSKCSTSLSVGSIRQQFSTQENIQLSKFGFNFLNNIDKHLTVDKTDPVDINLRHGRYLITAGENGVEILKENHAIQRELDCKVELLSASELKEVYPAFNTEGIAMASIGTGNEGWFDPWALLNCFKNKAMSLGVDYITAEVTNMDLYKGRLVSGVEISPMDSSSSQSTINCNSLVMTTGCWSGKSASLLGVHLPVEPRKRYVFVVDCPGLVLDDALVVLPVNGVWFRREGRLFICGMCPKSEDEPNVNNLEVDYDFFDNHVWPDLAQYVPAFECLKIQSAWAGYYDYNVIDQNAIVGYHPDISNLLFASGFSGHGIQHSPGIGRAVSELIIDQQYTSIDLSKLGYERVLNNKRVVEKNII